jgi:hypothetical protein
MKAMVERRHSTGFYRLNVFHGNATEPLAERIGTVDHWRLNPVIRVRFGDLSYSVRVDSLLSSLPQDCKERIEQHVDGLCTIVKFGDTMQLRETFRVVIEVNSLFLGGRGPQR